MSSKYRIVEYKNGYDKSHWRIQRRTLFFFWTDCTYSSGMKEFDTLERARNTLKSQLEYEENRRQWDIKKKVKVYEA